MILLIKLLYKGLITDLIHKFIWFNYWRHREILQWTTCKLQFSNLNRNFFLTKQFYEMCLKYWDFRWNRIKRFNISCFISSLTLRKSKGFYSNIHCNLEQIFCLFSSKNNIFFQSWCINPVGICNDLNLVLSNCHNF